MHGRNDGRSRSLILPLRSSSNDPTRSGTRVETIKCRQFETALDPRTIFSPESIPRPFEVFLRPIKIVDQPSNSPVEISRTIDKGRQGFEIWTNPASFQ